MQDMRLRKRDHLPMNESCAKCNRQFMVAAWNASGRPKVHLMTRRGWIYKKGINFRDRYAVDLSSELGDGLKLLDGDLDVPRAYLRIRKQMYSV